MNLSFSKVLLSLLSMFRLTTFLSHNGAAQLVKLNLNSFGGRLQDWHRNRERGNGSEAHVHHCAACSFVVFQREIFSCSKFTGTSIPSLPRVRALVPIVHG
jgi:hypothetical protein